MFRQGWLILGSLRGAPVRVHWSTPLGALFFSGFRFVPAFWFAFVVLILVHELGHAFVVRRARATVLSVDIMAYGGECAWSGRVGPLRRAAIAWGGVWAQMALLIATWIWLLVDAPSSAAGREIAHVFTRTNLWVMALNLIPFPPLDGAEAWRLFPLLQERWTGRYRTWRYTRATQDTRRRLAELDELDGEAEKPPPEVKAMVDRLLEDARTRSDEAPPRD